MTKLKHAFEKMSLPLHVLADGYFSVESFHNTFVELPQRIPNQFSQEIATLLEERKKQGRPDDNVRLVDHTKWNDRLQMTTAPATFASYLVINRKHYSSPESRENLNPEIMGDIPVPIIGTDLSIITEDDRIICVKRSDKVATYKNCYHVGTAGYFQQSHQYNEKPYPFATFAKELKEERGIECDLGHFAAMSLARDLNDYHIEFIGEVKVDYTSDEIKKIVGEDAYEEKGLMVFDLSLDSLGQILREKERWVPAGLAATAYTLARNYGEEKVARKLLE